MKGVREEGRKGASKVDTILGNANCTFVFVFSVSETQLLLLQGEPGHPPATQGVVMTVKVTSGSFLHPVTLHTDDGTEVLLQPTLSYPAGLWLAEVG